MSSVWLILPELNSERCIFSPNSFEASSSLLLTFATVTMANRPRWLFIKRGCASVSLIIPIPALPLNLSRLSSNAERKYVHSRLWIERLNPVSLL